MRTLSFLLFFLVAPAACLFGTQATAQVWGEISGQVTNADDGTSIPGATVLVQGTNFGSAADNDGWYRFAIPEGRYAVRVSAVGFETRADSVIVPRGESVTFDAALAEAVGELGEVHVEDEGAQGVGVSTIDPMTIRNMPTPVADALRSVKVQLGVTSNNELSNVYSVRGGSYAENQFFIDGFEIHRPLLASQGEQEGLSLVSGDLASRLTLYAGGFPVRYGGKLASVLEASYLHPQGTPSGTAYLSTLDAGAMVQGGTERAGIAVAARTARPSRLFGTQELEGSYDPQFYDVQVVGDLEIAEGHSLRAIGILARHRFRFAPSQRRTTFGIFPDLVRTVASTFEGEETDGYNVSFGGLKLTNRFGSLRAQHRVSFYETTEFEEYDITSETQLFQNEQDDDNPTEFDEILEGETQQRDIADNEVGLTNVTAGGRYVLQVGRHAPEVGWMARGLRFNDRLDERSMLIGRRDSTGEDGQPAGEVPFSVTADSLTDESTLDTWAAAFWAEETVDVLPERERLVLSAGARADYFAFTQEWTFSPRISALYNVNDNTSLTGSFGVYHQVPTYREFRGEISCDRIGEDGQPVCGTIEGALNSDIKSQRSVQGVVGFQHLFPRTRLTLRAEAYYKRLSNLISYDVENVRVVYSGENDSEGFAYGLDLQVRGELIPGLESWVNYGFLVSRERFLDPEDGPTEWIPRPSDRRHNLSVFVQDHIPGDDTWTVHVRALYGSGLPTTPPIVAERINNVSVFEEGERNALRFPSYRRFDMGVTKRVRIGRSIGGRPLMLHATAEVLNVFDMTNVIAWEWVDSSVDGFYEAVPTRLTPQTINVRLRVDF